MSLSFHRAVTLALAAAIATEPAFAATQLTTITQVDVPCLRTAESRLDQLQCKDVLRPTTGPNKGKGLLDLLDRDFETQLFCYYKNVYSNFGKMTDNSGCVGNPVKVGFAPFTHPICNLADGEGTAPGGTNHKGENCGRIADAHDDTTVDGKWEASLYQGLYVQAMKYYRKEAMAEIENGHKLNVTSPACEPLAKKLKDVAAKAQGLSTDFLQRSKAGGNEIPRELFNFALDFCAPNLDAELLKKGVTDPVVIEKAKGIGKGVACYLNNGRGGMEGVFSNLVTCEINGRVELAMAHYADIWAKKFSDMVNDCTRIAVRYGHDHNGSGLGRGRRRRIGTNNGKTKWNECYRPRAEQFYKDAIQDLFPGDRLQPMPSNAPGGKKQYKYNGQISE